MNLKAKMVRFLEKKFGDNFDKFSAEAAIYWFCADYHSGQWSELYAVLSQSEYRPSSLAHNVASEDEVAQDMYAALERIRNNFN